MSDLKCPQFLKQERRPLKNHYCIKDKSILGRKCVCNYCAEVSMFSYLQGTTWPEISMDIHHCACFWNNLRLVNKRAVRRITKYLVSMSMYVDLPDKNWQLTTNGVVYMTNIEKHFEFYVDSYFAVGWAQVDDDNSENVMLRMGYVITYAGCISTLFSSRTIFFSSG